MIKTDSLFYSKLQILTSVLLQRNTLRVFEWMDALLILRLAYIHVRSKFLNSISQNAVSNNLLSDRAKSCHNSIRRQEGFIILVMLPHPRSTALDGHPTHAKNSKPIYPNLTEYQNTPTSLPREVPQSTKAPENKNPKTAGRWGTLH